MTHEYYEELIGAAVDGELTAEEERELHAHLEQCESCRIFYEAMKAVSGAADKSLPEPPEDLTANVMAAVRAQSRQPGPRREEKKTGKLIRFPGRALALAAAAALVLWAGYRGLGGGRKSASMEAASVAAAGQAMTTSDMGVAEEMEAETVESFETDAVAEEPKAGSPALFAAAPAAPEAAMEEAMDSAVNAAAEDGPVITVRGEEILLNGEPTDLETLEERLTEARERGLGVTLEDDRAIKETYDAVKTLLDSLELPEGYAEITLPG